MVTLLSLVTQSNSSNTNVLKVAGNSGDKVEATRFLSSQAPRNANDVL
ncbi:hypothetical protein MS2017_1731 [Bathymodiolus thermophilus thioautotrophic gill symbiont]|uniref:Uncharacterized protein n=1 Tax=Bathymodiolus thermophilus thioautotrophic gill symbiont TaxID=2360 RepID=A0A3G3INM0_9GAMM|nr:hypothetical protein [Bathymodiolus thermophilus thioautotrophic gill symbiont]AYQ57405.1 hypothetical protein MS2017_1731 [Bathymodiolus thermophilus thioautotrophic gill symbiont]